MRRDQSPSEIPMKLISLDFTALYFRGSQEFFFFFFITQPSRGINHKFISREPFFRFAIFSSCIFLLLALRLRLLHPYRGHSRNAKFTQKCEKRTDGHRHGHIFRNNYLIFQVGNK